jgi:hypothetical protein
LVVRDSFDYGPASGNDQPWQRGTAENDQYAFKDPSVVQPLYDVLGGVKKRAKPTGMREFEKGAIEAQQFNVDNVRRKLAETKDLPKTLVEFPQKNYLGKDRLSERYTGDPLERELLGAEQKLQRYKDAVPK